MSLILKIFGDNEVNLKNIVASGFLLIGCGVYALDFSPASVGSKRGFASLHIGGTYAITQNTSRDYKSERGAVIFGIKRGLALGQQRKMLLNAWLDGSAGKENRNGLYGFSLGGQVGYRLFNGRIIAHLGGGFELQNLAIPEISTQRNQYSIYGGLVNAEIFLDIAKGYGLSVGYRRGFRYQSGKSELNHMRFNNDVFIVSFSYYAFSI